jgi:phage terminase large subunit GpA-like protein
MTESAPNPHVGRPFVGVHMKCCNTYTRAYLAADRSRYEGRCPRCGAFIRMDVVEHGGSKDRFFEAT